MPLSFSKMGRLLERNKSEDLPVILNGFLCFREIKYENNELDFSLPILGYTESSSLCICMFFFVGIA